MAEGDYPEQMGGDGFTPGTKRFAYSLFVICCLLLAPQIKKAFDDPEPEKPREPVNGMAISFPADTVCGGDAVSDTDLVAAIHSRLWKHPNPLKDINCGREIKVTESESGKSKSVTVKLLNKCMKGCKMTDIGLSPAALKKISKDGSEVKVIWDFTD